MSDPILVCSLCRAEFSKRDALGEHMWSAHPAEMDAAVEELPGARRFREIAGRAVSGTVEFRVPRGTPEATAALRNIMERVARGELKVEGMEADPKLGEAIRAGNALWMGSGHAFSADELAVRGPVTMPPPSPALDAAVRKAGEVFGELDRDRRIAVGMAPDGSVVQTETHVAEPEHPVPWRWEDDGGEGYEDDGETERPSLGLLAAPDANGDQDVLIDETSLRIGKMDLRVRALTEASPQLEGVLTRLVTRYDDDPEASGYQDLIDEARALLAQIEERSRG